MAEAETEADGTSIGMEIYHERQRQQLCLLHALNNLFQQKDAFTRSHLNALASRLAASSSDSSSPVSGMLGRVFSPHHNSLTGNYDANVLMAALELAPEPEKKKHLLWHDRRSPASSIDLAAPRLMGILLNASVPRLRGLWTSRHWLALRSIRGTWYNLDSDLPAPRPFPHHCHLLSFLDHALAQGAEIFLVFNLIDQSE